MSERVQRVQQSIGHTTDTPVPHGTVPTTALHDNLMYKKQTKYFCLNKVRWDFVFVNVLTNKFIILSYLTKIINVHKDLCHLYLL